MRPPPLTFREIHLRWKTFSEKINLLKRMKSMAISTLNICKEVVNSVCRTSVLTFLLLTKLFSPRLERFIRRKKNLFLGFLYNGIKSTSRNKISRFSFSDFGRIATAKKYVINFIYWYCTLNNILLDRIFPQRWASSRRSRSVTKSCHSSVSSSSISLYYPSSGFTINDRE